MPSAAPKPCTAPGCGKLVRDGSGRCEAHARPAWSKPATATKRVTGRKLQRMRAQLFTSNPLCVMCPRQNPHRIRHMKKPHLMLRSQPNHRHTKLPKHRRRPR
jgi:hypothetical protein